MRVENLTGATDERRPQVCQGCAWWQSRAGARPADRRRWIDETEERFGAWGKIYLDADRHVGSLQYGPADAYPRARDLPAGPPSDDAVLVTCAFLSDPSSPWSLQSLFLACIGESKDRGYAAVEAFAYRHDPGESFARRFLHHRTIFPRDFLADFGYRTLRSAGAIELMRLELGGLVPVSEEEGRLAEVVRRARALVARPAPAALGR
jgi:hypothetical protein